MQAEIDAENTGVEIRILGVNGIGQESGNASVSAGRTLPWLQDTAAENVWSTWAVTYRDVIILDTENKPIAVYNLTTHGLGTPANYQELKTILLGAAGN
jgi:hypothetical protein